MQQAIQKITSLGICVFYATTVIAMENGYRPQVYLKSKKSSFHRAASEQNLEELREILLSDDLVSINLLNISGKTPLHKLLKLSRDEKSSTQCLSTEAFEAAKLLIDQGANPGMQQKKDKQNAFHLAARSGKTAITKYMLVYTNLPELRTIINLQIKGLCKEKNRSDKDFVLAATTVASKYCKQMCTMLDAKDVEQCNCFEVAQNNCLFEKYIFSSASLHKNFNQAIIERYTKYLQQLLTKTIASMSSRE